MSVRALCVLLALVVTAHAAAAQDTVRLVENTNQYATLPAGALEQHRYEFVAAAAAVYNVRLTRHEPFADRTSAQRLCVHANSSLAPVCIPLAADGTDASGRCSVAVTARAPGTAFAVTVASAGAGYSYTVRYCRGHCAAQCDADCSGHGGCPVPGLWCTCDAGYRGHACTVPHSGSGSDDDDSSDWFGALLAQILAALVYGFLALTGTALLVGLVCALLVCAGVSLCAGACCCCAGACCAGGAAAATRPASRAVHATAAERQPLVVSVAPAAAPVPVPVSVPPPPPPPPYPAYEAYEAYAAYPSCPETPSSAVIPPAV